MTSRVGHTPRDQKAQKRRRSGKRRAFVPILNKNGVYVAIFHQKMAT